MVHQFAIHAMTGCESVSSFSQIGKKNHSRNLKRKLMSWPICATLVNFHHSLCNALPWLPLFSSFAICSHGTIIRTGITCKKIPGYMGDSACKRLIVRNVKIFQSYVKHFWIFPRKINCIILIGLYKQVFRNHLIMFLERHNKTKFVPASFSYFLELLWPL